MSTPDALAGAIEHAEIKTRDGNAHLVVFTRDDLAVLLAAARIAPNADRKFALPFEQLYKAADVLLLALDAADHGQPNASDCPICRATDQFRQTFYSTVLCGIDGVAIGTAR